MTLAVLRECSSWRPRRLLRLCCESVGVGVAILVDYANGLPAAEQAVGRRRDPGLGLSRGRRYGSGD